jgi:hypothetical protein
MVNGDEYGGLVEFEVTDESQRTGRKTLCSAALSTSNPKQAVLRSNPDLLVDKSWTN